MSTEHRRPLYAFVGLLVVAMLVVVGAARSDALKNLVREQTVDIVAATTLELVEESPPGPGVTDPQVDAPDTEPASSLARTTPRGRSAQGGSALGKPARTGESTRAGNARDDAHAKAPGKAKGHAHAKAPGKAKGHAHAKAPGKAKGHAHAKAPGKAKGHAHAQPPARASGPTPGAIPGAAPGQATSQNKGQGKAKGHQQGRGHDHGKSKGHRKHGH